MSTDKTLIQALVDALESARIGLCIGGNKTIPEGDFVPMEVLSYRDVKAALERAGWAGFTPTPVTEVCEFCGKEVTEYVTDEDGCNVCRECAGIDDRDWGPGSAP